MADRGAASRASAPGAEGRFLVADEHEAKTMEHIRELRAEGASLRAIAAQLEL